MLKIINRVTMENNQQWETCLVNKGNYAILTNHIV